MPPTHSRLMRHSIAHEWHPTASTLCPLSLPHRKAHMVSLDFAQNDSKLKRTIPREFSDCWWLFRTLHISHHGARLVEEKRKKNMKNSDFQLLQVCHFKILYTHCYYYCRLGRAL